MTQDRGSEEKVDRLVEMLIEETLASSDEEILSGVVDEGGDIERSLRAEIDSAIAALRRKRLMAAKEAIAANRKAPRLVAGSGGDLRAALAKVIASNDASFTLAAREGQDVPDADLDGLAEDLRDLGFNVGGEKDSDAS